MRAVLYAMQLLGLIFLSCPVRAQDFVIAPLDGIEPTVLYKSSHALVIGIGGYADGWNPLTQARNDARAVADELKRHGFSVTLETDENQRLDKRALERLIEDLLYGPGTQPDTRLLIWFAGHGFTVDGEGYLVPQGAPSPTLGPLERRPLIEAEFRRNALSLRRFGEYMRETRARHVLSIFDSCFAGSVFESTRAASGVDVTKVTARKVRHFISSGDAGQEVSDDGQFRKLFVDALNGSDVEADENKDGFITASELGRFLNYKITYYKKTVQVPRSGKLPMYGEDGGEFLFRVTSGPEVASSRPSSSKDKAVGLPDLPFAKRGTALPIYFVTDRQRLPDAQRIGFGDSNSQTLTLGKALVRRQDQRSAEPAASLNFALDGMSILEPDEFVDSFPPELERAIKFKDQVFIFLHGTNVSFDNAFYRTAQVAYDIGFDGPAIAYSWPASSTVLNYLKDIDRADVSGIVFAKFVRWLAQRTSINKINFVSHSAGARLLLGALFYLGDAPAEVKAKVGHLIFVAPDVGKDWFTQGAQRATGLGIGQSFTLYVSATDKALLASGLWSGNARAGDSSRGVLVVKGVDTIDVSEVSTDLFQVNTRMDNNVILSDISLILQNGRRPPSARLPVFQAMAVDGQTYWRWVK